MNILAIDTSNQILGIALMKDNLLVAETMTNIKKDHSSRLMPAIVAMMEEAQMTPDELDEIVVANGPGSYTGTRIGVTTAKTLAWSLQIPIYTVSSLESLAYNGQQFSGYICPFFDARRKTVFTGLYRWEQGRLALVTEPVNILMKTWLEKLASLEEPVLFLSPDMIGFETDIVETLKHHALIPENNAHILRASNLIYLKEHVSATEAHHVNPNYLRITEAEANLLKRQEAGNNHGGI